MSNPICRQLAAYQLARAPAVILSQAPGENFDTVATGYVSGLDDLNVTITELPAGAVVVLPLALVVAVHLAPEAA